MLISKAFAQTAPASGGFDFISLLPLVLIFVVFYFLLIRPQQKRMKAHKQMIENLRRGDRVITGGGIIATVTRVTSAEELTVEIAEGVRVRISRGTISALVPKNEGSPKDA